MSRVALPELRRYGYSGGFSTATLAAGGTLGILIPPSVILVIYAILTEQNIAKLFLAAFVPGILAAIGYMITISIYVRLNPDAPARERAALFGERIRALSMSGRLSSSSALWWAASISAGSRRPKARRSARRAPG
jgi:C4-dicarboxylate transporter DctM subunit